MAISQTFSTDTHAVLVRTVAGAGGAARYFAGSGEWRDWNSVAAQQCAEYCETEYNSVIGEFQKEE